jgi:hypothetical protein
MATVKVRIQHHNVSSTLLTETSPADDWRACGGDVFASLQSCIQKIEGRDLCESLACNLNRLLGLAQNAIRSVHHSKVDRKWRRLYTDICILKGVMAMTESAGIYHQTAVLDAIRDLDMAIIICGAPGLDRLEMIYAEIASLQREVTTPVQSPSKPANARNNMQSKSQEPSACCLASASVKETPSAPSLSDYLSRSHAEPFIVRNFASSWPAIQDEKHNWANGSYLSQIGGLGRVVPVEIGWQYTEADWYQDVIPWQDFLEAIGWNTTTTTTTNEADDKKKPQYLAQHNLFRQFPALELDIIVPDIVYSCPPAPAFFLQYRPPVDEDGLETSIVNAWIGPKGTTTPVHFDPYYNAYVQVVGQKLIWIAPPDIFNSEDGSLLDGNSSTLPVFDRDAPDTEQSKRINEQAMTAVLGPGDLLILPPGWFHAMRSLSRVRLASMM